MKTIKHWNKDKTDYIEIKLYSNSFEETFDIFKKAIKRKIGGNNE